MNLFNIAAALTLNSSAYEKGLEDAEGKASSFGDKLKSGLGTAGKIGGAAIAAVGAGAVALGKSFMSSISETAALGDNIDKMSQKMGISAEAYQEWDFVMQHCGTSIESLQSSMKTLATAAETGNEAFEKLGISQAEIANMSQEDLFNATIEALQSVESETERTYLAGQLLGRGATELGALLNMSAEDTDDLKNRVHELGGVMSDEAVKAAADYQDNLQDMQTAFTGVKRSLIGNFLPAVSTAMQGLADIFSGKKGGAKKVGEGVKQIVDTLSKAIPEFLPVVTSIVENISTAVLENLPILLESVLSVFGDIVNFVIENLPLLTETVLIIVEQIATSIGESLPTLIPAIVEAIVLIAETLIEHLPELLAALMTIIEGLATGIIDALPVIVAALPSIISGIVSFLIGAVPQLIQTGITLLVALIQALPEIITQIVSALPEIVTSIIDAILDNLPLVIQAGVDLFIALVENMPAIIEGVISAIPQIIESIVSAIGSFAYRIVEAGTELIKGLWEGIKNAASWLWEKVKGWASSLVDGILGFFGIHSPSTLFRDKIGGNMMKGLAAGIDEYSGLAIDAMTDAAKGITDAAVIDTSDIDMYADSSIGDGVKGGRQIIQNIYAQKQSPAEIFEESLLMLERAEWVNV